MSEINRIADLLRDLIKSRQVLAVGTAQSAAVPGSPALYETSSGTIRAIATNFCYGNCLLAKVEGTWYAINPSDNRAVIRGNVDRLIQRRPSIGKILPVVSIEFAPGSPTELKPQKGRFTMRIEIDRIQEDDLRVKSELSGTATLDDYTYSGLDDDLIVVIPAGELFVDIYILPYRLSKLTRTVVVTLLQDSEYDLHDKKTVTAKIKPVPFYKYTLYVYKDIVRSLFYQLRPDQGPTPENLYSFTEATQNASNLFTGVIGTTPSLIGAPLAYNYGHFLDPSFTGVNNLILYDPTIPYQQFAARMYTPVYTKESSLESLPYLSPFNPNFVGQYQYDVLAANFFTPTDQSPDIDLPAYRYLTGLSTSPAGDPCPLGYTPPLRLTISNDIFEMVNPTEFPAPYTVLGGGTYWVYFIVDPYPYQTEPQRNFMQVPNPTFSFTREEIPPTPE